MSTRKHLPPDEARNLLVGVLEDFAQNDCEDLFLYLEHVDFDFGALGSPRDLLPAWLGHYRISQGIYDTDRAATDLATWPPIARRILELRAEKQSLA